MSGTPAGWYDDGQTPGQLRWFDGTQWTDQFQPAGAPVPPAQAFAQPAVVTPPLEEGVAVRLLDGEAEVRSFPIASRRRALGSVTSRLLVTDRRLVYSARAKSLGASSIHVREFDLATVTGIEVGRRSGLDALGLVAGLGAALNFLGLVIAAIVIAVASRTELWAYALTPYFGFIVVLAIASLVLGAGVVFVLSRPTAVLRVVAAGHAHDVSDRVDLARRLAVLVLFLLFGLWAAVAVVAWALVRELGAFRATDAERYADPAQVETLAIELGAVLREARVSGDGTGAAAIRDEGDA